MNNFNLAEEMVIANMINGLNSPIIRGELSDNQVVEIRRTICKHIYESNLKMKSPISNNIAATPTTEDRRKLTPADEAAARLWGEEPDNSYTPHL